MNKTTKFTGSALAAMAALGIWAAGSSVSANEHEEMEKCYGIAKAHHNDCASDAHSCAGQATEDDAAGEWVYVPTGTCEEKGGHMMTEEDHHEEGEHHEAE